MLITITNEQKVLVTLNPVTAAGNPATVDGAPVWQVASGDATLEVQEGGMSAYLISGAADVTSKVMVSADADLGEGVASLEDSIDLVVIPATASTLGLVSGTPELK